ncbi:alanine racemase [Candidatus Nomurabacteria bacterium]|nr:alanine racemase [Candidatus Nomurabacteria bacterium]
MKLKNAHDGLRTWLEIDEEKVAHNYHVFRKLLDKKTKLLAVVKSNAYGHDLFQFAKLQEKLGADWLGVDSIVEGEALRDFGIKIPILVLGYTLPEKFAEAVKYNLSLTISSFENLELLKKWPAKFHLKIDTGMHRQGFLPTQIDKVLKFLQKNKIKNFEGIYTHFPAAKNPAFPNETRAQLKQFLEVTELARKAGFHPLSHAAATSGAIVFPESQLDLARIGIGLYGFYPSKEVAAGFQKKLNLRPVLSWKSIVSEVKNLPAGSKLGYDGTEKLAVAGKIAICPIGYWHGYPRSLSSIGKVLIRGQFAKILGRISMDMIIVDVSTVKGVRVGNIVTLIGQDGKNKMTADELSNLSDTVNYETVTQLNPLMKRVYF